MDKLSISFTQQEARDFLLNLANKKGGEVGTNGIEMGFQGPKAISDWDIFLAKHIGLTDQDAFMLHSLLEQIPRAFSTSEQIKIRAQIRNLLISQ